MNEEDGQIFEELNDALARTGTWGVILNGKIRQGGHPNREAAVAALARLMAAEDLAHLPAWEHITDTPGDAEDITSEVHLLTE